MTTTLILVFISLVFSYDYLTRMNEYRKIQVVYNDLKYRRYVRDKYNIKYVPKLGFEHFIYFVDEGVFASQSPHEFVLANDVPFFQRPINYYWWCRYKRWFRKNVDINQLPVQ